MNQGLFWFDDLEQIPCEGYMQVNELIQYGIKELKSAGIGEPESDCFLLLGSILGKNRTELFIAAHECIAPDEQKQFLNFLERRKRREPAAYIIKEKEFWSLPFHVSSDVLIPRPETEFLLETVFNSVQKKGLVSGRIADICCGSGVIGIVLSLELAKKVVSVDISARALDVAAKNSRRHNVANQVSFIQGDLLSGFQSHSLFSLIVSNPPYVSRHELINSLEPEVTRFEPHLALDGGERGMELIRQLRTQVVDRLLPGGYFFMEIGFDQGKEVEELFSLPYRGYRPLNCVKVIQDYSGRDRVLYGELPL